MMVSKVRGQFDSYDLTDLTTASIAFEFDVASINTHSEDRDNHLRSEDFFDVEKYPTITFQSTDIQKDGDDYEVTGDWTIKGVTKPVTFEEKRQIHGEWKCTKSLDLHGTQPLKQVEFSLEKILKFEWN